MPPDEQGMRRLHSELMRLKRISSEEMRSNVMSNYQALIRTLQKLAGLEGCLTCMESLLLSRSILVRKLMTYNSASYIITQEKSQLSDDFDECSLSKTFLKTLDQIDVFLLEQKTEDAVKALQGGKDIYESHKDNLTICMAKSFQMNLDERRSKLINQLVGATKKISVQCIEVRAAIAALNQLGEGVMGHNLLLELYHKRIKAGISDLNPSGTLYGGLYTAGLSQCVFSGIVNAINTSSVIFGENSQFSSNLVLWARKETREFVSLLIKHVLLVSYGLKAMVECVRIAYGHCLLVDSKGLSLYPFLSQALRPTISCVLQRHLKHIQESVVYLAAADYWVLEIDYKFRDVKPMAVSQKYLHRSKGEKSILFFEPPEKLTSSAYHLDMLTTSFASDSAFLAKLHLDGVLMNNLALLFRFYMQLLKRALTTCNIGNGHLLQNAQSMEQQTAILVNATVLTNDRFPCCSYIIIGEIFGDKERFVTNEDFMHYLETYRPHLCGELIRIQSCFSKIQKERFLEEFSYLLTSDVYIYFQCSSQKSIIGDEVRRPSAFFEELFVRLSTISGIVSKVIKRWRCVVSLPLLNILKGVLLWLKTSEDFWTGIEANKEHLIPEGCVQMVFDLHFVTRFALEGQYMSKSVKNIISDLICAIQDIYAQQHYDPQRYYLELMEAVASISGVVLFGIHGGGGIHKGESVHACYMHRMRC
ncbi:hypothetical protein KP509_16G058800 [Ceratopteris richardii]|uniref:Exocyst component Exo84 C-terminal domain-containing protein n=1 Tax=Ceratopteris richardii TaxID=49495 RepID=A0A8T2T3C9_CERRI|nr:hypothetical protein KP509_16G058800 [Ceratopteris richardii]